MNRRSLKRELHVDDLCCKVKNQTSEKGLNLQSSKPPFRRSQNRVCQIESVMYGKLGIGRREFRGIPSNGLILDENGATALSVDGQSMTG